MRKQFDESGEKADTQTMTDTKKSKVTRSRTAKTRFDKDPLPDKIGTSLRNLYDEVLNEDVPDDFLNLLRKADEAST